MKTRIAILKFSSRSGFLSQNRIPVLAENNSWMIPAKQILYIQAGADDRPAEKTIKKLLEKRRGGLIVAHARRHAAHSTHAAHTGGHTAATFGHRALG
jgi:hypothetical protein